MDRYKVKINDKSHDVEIEKTESIEFDYEAYEKSLEKIVEQSQKEYWTHYTDINRHQIIVGRNNLWVAVAFIGALSTLYSKHHETIDMMSIIGVTFIISFLSVMFAFGVCLYAMPARKGYKAIYNNSWVDFSLSAHSRLENKDENAYANFLSELIRETENANAVNLETNADRGKLLRITSWLLISSFVFSLICFVLFIINQSQSNICSILIFNVENYMRCICEQ